MSSLLRRLMANIALQIVSLVILMGLISVAYAAYTTITPASIATGQPVSQSLMQQIKDNLDDLNDRINKGTQSTTASAGSSIMPNNMAYGAGSSILGSTVTLSQGVYFFQMYLCSGQYDTGGAVPSIGFISGNGYSPSTFINNGTLTGTCGVFYTGVLKVASTTANVAMKLESYGGNPMADLNPGANAFSTQFIRIQ